MTPTTNQPVTPTKAPTGPDLHPRWTGIVRLSKLAALIVGLLVLIVIVGCLYGVVRRSVAKMQIASQGELKRIAPATQAGQDEGFPATSDDGKASGARLNDSGAASVRSWLRH